LEDQYCCLGVTFQQGFSFESKKDFWTTFGGQLQRRNKHVRIPQITSTSECDEFLDGSNKEKLFGNKQVVLFVDEFDLLYDAKDDSVIEDVLNVLRGIKQTKKTSSLHSFVGIGPFSIRSASGLLLDRLPTWATMQKLGETLQDPISEKARTLMLTHFLPSNSPVKVTLQVDKLARFLTAEGALVNTDDDRMVYHPHLFEILS
jgi:hypothetical protein